MSVAWYSDGELRALYDALGGSVAETFSPHPLKCILLALGLANRTAHLMAYGEADDGQDKTLPIPDLDVEPKEGSWGSTVTVREWARNLLYNCVTNSGTDFAPEPYALALMRMATAADSRRQAACPTEDEDESP